MRYLNTVHAPEAIGPYSQGIQVDSWIFVSGQLPIDPISGQIPEDIRSQVQQSLENVKAVLLAAGSSLDRVVKTTLFLASMENFPVVNAVYADYFQGARPARSTVEVSRLPKDALIEIEVIARA
ncbi:RidA family protein [Pseudomonas sp. TE50-2]|jgi:2-iminobutanoate/2-iminopropanoate deaminase|uniref:RidA family protein n=1 Tax=Pseudomonas sp. TE50-2 TaxID=3142707 RepID=UPI0034663B07